MRIDVISVQPQMLEGFLRESILGRAVKKGICEINLVDLRDFGEGRWKKVDDKPYGGGPGMLMKCGPWFAAVEHCLGKGVRQETRDASGAEGERQETRDASGAEGERQETRDASERLETGDAPVGLAPRAGRSETREDQSSTGANGAKRNEQTGELRIIMTSPAGKPFTQRDAEMFAALSTPPPLHPSTPPPLHPSTTPPFHPSTPPPLHPSTTPPFSPHLIFLCGHYEGFDARIETLATDIYSVGDFVMTGGELAAAAMVDSIVRLLPGVLGGGPAATSNESFSADGLLEAPQYTHPPEFRGMKVPEVLLSGDHAKIEAWRAREARKRTERLAPLRASLYAACGASISTALPL